MVDRAVTVDPTSATRPGGLPSIVRVYDEHLPVRLGQGALENTMRSLFIPGTGLGSTTTNGIVTFGLAATHSATNAAVRDRSTHTGTQTSATISDFTEATQDAVAAFLTQGTGVTLAYDDAGNRLTVTAAGGTGGATDLEAVRDAIGVALIGVGNVSVVPNDTADTITITTTATQNSTDAALRDRGTHTGSQTISTVTGLSAALAGKLTIRGEFAPGLTYAVNDLVHVGPNSFYALIAHVSANPAPVADSTYWKQLGSGGSGGGSYAGAIYQIKENADGTWPLRPTNYPAGSVFDWTGKTIPPYGNGYALDGVDRNTVMPA